MLSQKDIIEINKQFSSGTIVNSSSLDFAVKMTARSKNWLRTSAILSRAILVDHIFEDGNKRTAAAVMMAIMELNKIEYNVEKIPKMVIDILKKNITSVVQIERRIKDARK